MMILIRQWFKTTLDRYGRPQTLVTEIDGDNFKTHRASSAHAALQEALKTDHTSSVSGEGRGNGRFAAIAES